MSKPAGSQDMWRDKWVDLQEPEAVLCVFHFPAQKTLKPLGNLELDTLAQVQGLATEPSVDTADWVQKKRCHDSAQVAWHTAKHARLPLKHSGLANIVTTCPSYMF